MDKAALLAQLRLPDTAARKAALEQCQTALPLPEELILAILPLTADSQDELREQAVMVCEEIREPSPNLAAPLARLLPTAIGNAAYWCVTLIGRLGPAAAPAVPTLAICLERHEMLAVRERAAWALGQIGPAASPAREALERAAHTTDPRLSRLAHEALQAIDSP